MNEDENVGVIDIYMLDSHAVLTVPGANQFDLLAMYLDDLVYGTADFRDSVNAAMVRNGHPPLGPLDEVVPRSIEISTFD